MFAQIFESEPARYFLPSELYGIPDGIGLGSLYHPELVTPPRIYAEEISSLTGLFVTREKTPWSDFTIHLLATIHQIYWPSYNYIDWRFDGMTGAYLDRRVGLAGTLYDYQIHQARDGSLWRTSILGSFFEVDPQTFEEIPDTRQDPDKYGAIELDLPMVDRAQNLVVMASSNENRQIGVYNFTTGALVRRINIGGIAAAIVPEDARRCYVLTNDNLLNLIDYSTGVILSTLKMPDMEAGAADSILAWDRYLRRLLRFTWRANAVDGACLSTIAGFYPVPIAVGLTNPIPLRPPRRGRAVPCLARAYGDAGEPISGLQLSAEASGDASIGGAPAATDDDGEAIVTLNCDAAGSATLDLSATV
jgi:hypothetical protein